MILKLSPLYLALIALLALWLTGCAQIYCEDNRNYYYALKHCSSTHGCLMTPTDYAYKADYEKICR